MLPITWITGLLVTGMTVALLGSIKVDLAGRLRMDEGKVGGLVSMFGFAMIPVMLVMGFLTDWLDQRIVLIAGAVLIAVSLVVLSRAKHYGIALVATLLLSAGWSGLINVLNVRMGDAFGGAPTFHMNLGNFFFGLGAFLTPMCIAYLLKSGGWSKTLWTLAAAAALPALLALAVQLPEVASDGASQTGLGVGAILASPIFWLCAVALLFYAPMEATMGAWATTYLDEKNVSGRSAAMYLSGFWLAFMLSRLAMAMVVSQYPLSAGGTGLLIIGLSLVCLAAWALAAFTSRRPLACAAVLLAGLAFGPTFPTIIGVLTGNTPPELGGRAVGLFFMVGGVGWSVIPIRVQPHCAVASASSW